VDQAESEGPEDTPGRHVTIDQLVAANMRHWRIAAGMTQEELGQSLGWSAANVSAAERSADSSRDPRRFNAQTLTDLSLALSVPLIALFLPPEDDGTAARYTFTGAGTEHDMGDLTGLVVMTDSDDDAPVMQQYRRRLMAAAGRYLDERWQDEVARWLRTIEPAELRAERAGRLRAGRDGLLRAAAELDSIAGIIDPAKEIP